MDTPTEKSIGEALGVIRSAVATAAGTSTANGVGSALTDSFAVQAAALWQARDFAKAHTKELEPKDIEQLALALTARTIDRWSLHSETALEEVAWTGELEPWAPVEDPPSEEYKAAFMDRVRRDAKRIVAIHLAAHWPHVLHTWQVENAARLGVAHAMKVLKDEPGAQGAEGRLREAVGVLLGESAFQAGAPWPWPRPSEEIEADGMAAPLARLIEHLRVRFCSGGSGPATEALNGIAREGREKLAQWKTQERIERIEPPPSPWQSLTPKLIASIVAQILWVDRVRGEIERERASADNRQREIPAPTAHPIVRLMVAHRARGGTARSEEGGIGTGWRLEFNDYADTLPPQAQVMLARDVLAVTSDESMPLLAPLVAYLVRETHARWLRGEDRFEVVPLLLGRHELRQTLGVVDVKNPEAEILRCLEWLRAFSVCGHRCVDGWWEEEVRSGLAGGRPKKQWLVREGPALAPQGLARMFKEAGMTLPPDLRFYAPVLNPAAAPLAGNRRTRERQRTFFSLGLGALLMEHREEYAERGGVALDTDMWRQELKRQGIYHRSHASLADTIFDAIRAEPAQGSILPNQRTGPVLVEVTSGRYRFGPDFSPQHQAVLAAAGVTAEAQAERERQKTKRRRRGLGSRNR